MASGGNPSVKRFRNARAAAGNLGMLPRAPFFRLLKLGARLHPARDGPVGPVEFGGTRSLSPPHPRPFLGRRCPRRLGERSSHECRAPGSEC